MRCTRPRALGAVVDEHELAVVGCAVGRLLQQDVAEGDDRHQRVVEVVSDAASQRAERFHLLRLMELLLELVALPLRLAQLGRVAADADELHRIAGRIQEEFGFGADRTDLAVETADAVLRFRR
jgi:hypothetical protein